MRIPNVKKQADLFSLNRDFAPGRIAHGDGSCIGRRKLSRPFKRNCAIHLVMKSTNAKGRMSLLTGSNKLAVARIVAAQAARFGVKIHSEQNVGNHLHALVSCGCRKRFQNFLRAVAGLIARAILKNGVGRFWTQPIFTRLVTGRRDFFSMRNYIVKNQIEAAFGKAERSRVEEDEESARKERRRELARMRRNKNSSFFE